MLLQVLGGIRSTICTPLGEGTSFGTGKGVATKGVFSLEESLKSLNSLESPEKQVRFSFVFHVLGVV